MKKLLKSSLIFISSILVIFGLATILANPPTFGITQNISFNDSEGNSHLMEFNDGILVNYTFNDEVIETFLPSSSNLIAYYALEDSTNSIQDSTGVYDGVARNGTTLGATGKIGDAIELNGVDNLVTISSLSSPKKITLSAWVKPTPTSGAFKPIVGANDVNIGPSLQSWNFGYEDDNFVGKVFVPSGSNTTLTVTGVNISDGSFHNLVMTYDGSNLSLYLDGVLKTSSTSPNGDLIEKNGVALGAFSDITFGGQSMFSGVIDEVGIWNTSLSQSEIEEIYNGGSGLTY